ncbi:MAG: DNA polymerase III subunit gamma and tau [Propionicimonas sp.]|uniref:DNA polymerase III subunit gamma and tau n=1 Tax=Propionicimonas sp. TaxID=1955623 RepID=UPI003D0A486F
MEVVDALRQPSSDQITRPETPLALYRRYRPDAFADVIGQEHVTEPLQRALTNNRVNHAYLFSGPRGCGKTTSARILARCLNCAEGPTPTPCGKCQSCRDLARGGAGGIDVIEIDAASHGGVDDARDLRERAFFAPVHSRYKIYIIDEAHMVTPQGFNALLKVVEEPPPHVRFVFATTEPDKVLGTIRSRTHHYPFRLVPPKTLQAYLAKLCEAEGIAVEPAVLPLVVRAGAGSVRDSLSVLDQLLGGAADDGVSYSQATSLLGYTPDALLDEIVDAFAAGDAQGVFAAVDKVIEVGQDPRRFAEDLLRRLRDLIIVAAVPEALSSGLVDVAGDQADRLAAQANALGPGELTRAAEVIAVGLTEMRGTTAPRLHLELMCARVLLPGADVDGRGLHARLDRLERRLSMGVPAGAEPGDRPVAAAAAPSATAEPQRSVTPAPSTVPEEPRNRAAAPSTVPEEPRNRAAAPSTVPEEPRGEERAPRRHEGPPSPEPAVTTTDAPPWDVDPAPAAAPEQSGSAAATPAPEEPRSEERAPRRHEGPPASRPAEATTAPEPPAPAPTGDAGGLGTADVRRFWPQILDNVKNRRRFTWILLSQNAQVVEVRDGVLTLGLSNAGARDSFGRGGSPDVLREAVIEVLGAALHINPIVDATAEPTPSPSAPASAPAEPPASPASPPRSAAAEAARANLRATRSQATPTEPEPEEEPSRDDVAVAEDAASADELIRKHLGAELIAEDDE